MREIDKDKGEIHIFRHENTHYYCYYVLLYIYIVHSVMPVSILYLYMYI